MKNKHLILIVLLLTVVPQVAFSDMSDYCSAPPYVTRTIAPNIMILMDNSEDMMGPAYTDEEYSPNATKDNYFGYFEPTGCYSESSNTFNEVLNVSATPNRSYNAGESCPVTAPYRGNLLNWATMSKFDVLQKVLIGGNSASKQGNAHTLVSISGSDWPTKYEDATVVGTDADGEDIHNGCVFKISNGNLTMTEEVPNSCHLLDSPLTQDDIFARQAVPDTVPQAIKAVDGFRRADFSFVDSLRDFSDGASDIFSSFVNYWNEQELVTSAWAAASCTDIQAGVLNGTMGDRFDLVLTLPQNLPNKTATWTVTTMPAWLSGPTYAVYNNKLNDGIATWSGTPTSAGNHAFEVSVTSDGCTGTSTISANISIEAESLKINHTSPLPAGSVGEAYSLELHGQGGTGALSWSAAGLPDGLSIGTFTSGTVTNYYIMGTPTTVGTSTVTLTVTDSATTPVSLSKNFELSILEGLAITTVELPTGQEGAAYTPTMSASGGNLSSATWTITSGSLPSGISMDTGGVFSGTLAAGTGADNPTNYPVTIQVADANGDSVDKSFTISIVPNQGHVVINSGATLPATYKGDSYSEQIDATGGLYFVLGQDGGAYDAYAGGYMWWVDAATPLPDWMSLDTTTGILSGTPDNNTDTTYTFVIHVMAGGHHEEAKTFSITSYKKAPTAVNRSKSFTVKVELIEEPLTDLNGNDAWDLGETYTDSNGNGKWDGKHGVFHKFWDATDPRARWGMTKTKEQGGSTEANVNTCIPVNNASTFFTNIQNATSVDTAPLADALYGAINYYGFNAPYGTGFSGCTNSDPIDNVPCRKNFVLMITSGDDLTGTSFADDIDSNCTKDATLGDAADLVQNACYGYRNDLRSDSTGTQNVYTYIVNTMGTDTGGGLEATALAGGGGFYQASNGSDIEDQLTKAIEDILAQAASGTAVSVLTTSSRGIGSMMQAYFLPIRPEGAREVRWTGYVQNLWIDPDDNLREDTASPYQLKIADDKVLKLYFDEATNETKAALFTESQLEACADPAIKNFDEVSYTWEGGLKLATRKPSERTLFTAKKVLHTSGTTTITTTEQDFTSKNTLFNTSMDTALKTALDSGATYTDDEVIGYIRGECLEGSVSGDTDCSATLDADFRDRRVMLSGGAANGNVWKLGDVISSTPKVLANTPSNTYHIDYGDTSYFEYLRSSGTDFVASGYADATTGYADRSALALVGANDGVLHAFRVGYLKDTGLDDGVLGLFKDFFSDADTDHDQIGEEVWGYIPFNALPYLKYLADPDYCHIYYNDLSVRLTDASLGDATDSAHDGPTDPKVKESWKTILIGGMRFGGACAGETPGPPLANVGYSAYYALDITDSEHPVPLWEFSDEDMGYATGFPSILRTGAATTNGHWYVAFGSGSTVLPKASTDMGRTKDGYLYVLNLKTGELVKKITLDHDAIVGDVLTIDKNKDYITEKLYFGTSYNDAGIWKGKLVSLDIPNQDLSASWTPTLNTIFTGDFPFTASPDAANDESNNTWVYAGSGKYFSDVDENYLDNQIFVGIKDAVSGETYPVTIADTDVVDKTNATTEGTVAETASVCTYDPTISGNFGMKDVVTRASQTLAQQTATVPGTGWYVTLSDGERVISRPLAVGGLVDFLTYKPSSDDCSYGGDSYLYAVGYKTGEAPAKIAIRNDQSTGGVTSGAVTVSKGIKLGPGAPPTGEAIIIPPPKEAQSQLKKKIQVATGVIVEAENTPAISITSEIVHWLKK
jgi:type IV pilus assembly protein PilY1